MTTIGSIGIGLFVLIIVWIVALVVFVIAVRTQSVIGWIVLGVATVVTAILLIIPTESAEDSSESYVNSEKDYSYVYKNILFAFLLLSAFAGVSSVFLLHCIEPVHSKPVKFF